MTVADSVLYVDPTCPFAWITAQWYREVARLTGGPGTLRLMSLSAVNEGRELEPWYRDYNDRAWLPARVAAALLDSRSADAWPAFYDAFGRRRHIEGLRDDRANLRATLAELDLPATLGEAADDPGWDDDLRSRTREACDPLAGEGGTPVLHIGDRGFFGPVLTRVPRGDEALCLWEAVSTLSGTAGFSELRGARDEGLQTV